MLDKISKKERKLLEGILGKLKTGQAFIMKSSTLVCVDYGSMASDAYVNSQGQRITSINKQVGSELAVLHSAISQLEQALKSEEQEPNI